MSRAFSGPLLAPDRPVPPGLRDASGASAGRRYDVYRNNVMASLIDALLVGFPVLTRLLGEANMRGLARLYARAHPPASPLMMYYGADMPEFLAGMSQLAHLPYLGDVARLELALRQSYHAADAEAIDPGALGRIAPEALISARVTLAPALAVLRSAWPLHDIWRFNTETGAPKPRPTPQDIAILRPGFDPEPVLLPKGAADWIAALQAGLPFGAALDAATAVEPDFELSAALGTLLNGGGLITITPDAQDAS